VPWPNRAGGEPGRRIRPLLLLLLELLWLLMLLRKLRRASCRGRRLLLVEGVGWPCHARLLGEGARPE
jgi:hypothetical protein